MLARHQPPAIDTFLWETVEDKCRVLFWFLRTLVCVCSAELPGGVPFNPGLLSHNLCSLVPRWTISGRFFSSWLLFPDFAEILESPHNPITHGCSWN